MVGDRPAARHPAHFVSDKEATMDIGTEGEPYISEPIQDPFRKTTPAPQRETLPEPTPLPEPVRTPEKVPA